MSPIETQQVGPEDFERDVHARKFRNQIVAHPQAFRQLLATVNDPQNARMLVKVSEHDRPALEGIISLVENEPSIEKILKAGESEYHFRRAVGVAIKLKMEKLGWCTTGKKKSVRGARYFTKAEVYVKVPTPKLSKSTGHVIPTPSATETNKSMVPESEIPITKIGLLRSRITVMTLAASVLVTIGGVTLLYDGRLALGITMLATAVMICAIGVVTRRWAGELTQQTGSGLSDSMRGRPTP